jgi:hypothetical protein
MPDPELTQAWMVLPKNDPKADPIFLCLSCTVKGVDDDMIATELTVDGSGGSLYCELCDALIIKEVPDAG